MDIPPADTVAANEVREALACVLNSRAFSASPRLRSLLTYVVEETLSGRADAIRAKTIGMDVYGYSAEDIVAREGVVRVDAGRVRRKLQDYYQQDDCTAAVIISLPLGSYGPRFERRDAASQEQGGWRRTWIALGIAALVLASVSFGFYGLRESDRLTGRAETGAGFRDIYDISPARVEATNLAGVGRDMIFPAVDPARLEIALLTFDAVIDMDPTYFGGYAGAAQVLATLALLTGDPVRSSELSEMAAIRSQEATRLSPDAAWALSARSWVSFLAGDMAGAVELSQRAVNMTPHDPHVAEFDSLISLYASDFDRIFKEAERRDVDGDWDRGFVFQNVLGAAKYHTGDYPGAIAEFESAIRAGGPFGPVSIAYLMAALYRNGDTVDAAGLADLLGRRWPDSRVDLLFARLFDDPATARDLADGMRGAGWKPSEKVSGNRGGAGPLHETKD